MNIFKHTKRANLLIMAAGVSVAMFAGWNAAFAGIAGSKHDLGSSGTSPYKTTTGTAEVCVFCHTPETSSDDAVVPKWGLGHRFGHYHPQAAICHRCGAGWDRRFAGLAGKSSRASKCSNKSLGLCPKNRSAAVVPSGRLMKKLWTTVNV